MTQSAADSRATERTTSPSALIPNSQVVILREGELDCDLATAIRRVRDNEETSRSRILVIGAEDGGEVSVQDCDVLPCPSMPMTPAQLGRKREVGALGQVGGRMLALLSCLERFDQESSDALADLDDAIEDQSRARLKGKVAVLREIREWTLEVAADLRTEASAAAEGRRLIDTHELFAEIIGLCEMHFPGVRIHLAAGGERTQCRGRGADLAEAFFLGLVLTAHRIGGAGAVQVEIARRGDHLAHRIYGLGEPRPVAVGALIERFREIVVAGHGGRVLPDAHGPHGTGLTLELPLGP